MYGSGDTDDTLLKGFVKFKVVCQDLQVYVRHASLVPCSMGPVVVMGVYVCMYVHRCDPRDGRLWDASAQAS